MKLSSTHIPPKPQIIHWVCAISDNNQDNNYDVHLRASLAFHGDPKEQYVRMKHCVRVSIAWRSVCL